VPELSSYSIRSTARRKVISGTVGKVQWWTWTYFRRAPRVYDYSKSCSAVVYSTADSNEWILFLEHRHDFTRLYRVRKWRWSL